MAIDAARVVVWEWDVQNDKTTWSDNAEATLGFAPGAFGNDFGSYMMWVLADDREPVNNRVARALQGNEDIHQAEYRVVQPNGNVRWTTASGRVLRDLSGKPVRMTGTMMDITERKRTENLIRVQRDLAISQSATKQLNEVLSLCLEMAVKVSGMDCGGIYLYDANSGSIELAHHTGLSPDFIKAVSHFGADSDQVQLVLRGQPVYSQHAELEVALAEAELHEALRSIAIIPIYYEGRVIGCMNVSSHVLSEVPSMDRDALETIAIQIGSAIASKRAEEELREGEIRFRELFNNIRSGVAVYKPVENGSDFVVTDLNRAAEQIDKQQKEDVIGKKVTEVFPAVKEFGLFELFQRVYKTGKPEYHPISLYKDEKITGWRENNVYKLPSGEIVAVYDDVTERKQAEEQVQKRQTELLHVSRLTAIGEMTSGLAHQLNQPLCAVVNYTNACLHYIRRGNADTDKLIESMEAVVKQTERAGEVINSIKNFVAKHEMRTSTVDINVLIRQLPNFITADIRRCEVSFNLALAEHLPMVLADPIQIEQVLLNLILNGIEAMADIEPGKRQLTIQTSSTDHGVEIAVCDTGNGLPDDVCENIFDSFFTTKPDGMGIGLSISRTIVEAHKGRIWLDRGVDCGATFRFTLPSVEMKL